MCLYIRRDQEENEKDLKKWFGSRKEFAYVYKVLRKDEDEEFYRSPHFPKFIWDFNNQKIFQVDRPNRPTEDELRLWHIDYGLHVYLTFKEAKKNCFYIYNKIVKFRVLKKDIIAVNNNWFFSNRCLKEAVCRKLTFVKIIED